MTDRPGAPELELPAGLSVEPVTLDRLVRQLASAPDTVLGIVAAVADLPAGASTRTHAEWRSLLPLDQITDVDAGTPGGSEGPGEGAVLRRPGPPTADGVLRVDPGAVAHRTSVDAAPDEDAGPEGRSPFPWRPIVLFLALDDRSTAPTRSGEDLDELLEALLDVDVEPRLAAPFATTASRRHRPCAPTAATVEQLGPDVLVALDPAALETGPGWCTRRGTVVIDMTGSDLEPAAVELVPWRIGTHPGRIRARVGRSVDAAALARLVSRLAAGPQPIPPHSGDGAPATDRSGAREVLVDVGHRRAPPRRIAVVGPSGRALLDSLSDRASVAGHHVDRDPGGAGDADVVLIAAETLSARAEATTRLLAERAANGRPTVAVVEDGDDPDQILSHLGAAGALAAVSTDTGTVDRLRGDGVPAQLVPTMTSTTRVEALREAAALPVTPSAGVIGWTIVGPGGAPGPDDGAVAAALVALLDERADLTVEIEVDRDAVPEPLRGRTGVAVSADRPDPGEQVRHTVRLLTGPPGAPSDRLRAVLIESGHLGVPTLIGATTARAVGGLADPRMVVPSGGGGSDPWADRLRRLLDGSGAGSDRAGASARARAASEELDAPATTDLVISRLLGWLDRRERS